MSTLTFGFIGLGLIGGSIARAIRQNLPQSQIIAYDINADTLREASQCGVANTITTKIDASFSTCDYLFLCAPVQKNDPAVQFVYYGTVSHERCLLYHSMFFKCCQNPVDRGYSIIVAFVISLNTIVNLYGAEGLGRFLQNLIDAFSLFGPF